jgi:hypothetical protein
MRRVNSAAAGAAAFIAAVLAIVTLAAPAVAEDSCWGSWVPGLYGWSWSDAFPERQQFGALSPEYAAAVAAGTNTVSSPMALIADWHRLPNDLRQWDCGTDSLGQAKRCLDVTFLGSGEYAGKSVTAHFDTLSGQWHFIGFEFHQIAS